jgi:hypothetical protein
MTVCSNAVENLHIGASARAENVKPGTTRMRPAGEKEERGKGYEWESLRDSGKATLKTHH